MISLYKFGCSLNASHSMDYKKKHPHTFKITLYIQTNDVDVNFNEYEKLINEYFETFRGKYLNEIPPFDEKIPTLENMANVFYEKINEILLDCDLDLKRLEIGDNYTVFVSLGEIIMVGSNNRIIKEEKFKKYKEKILKKYNKKDYSIKENPNIQEIKVEKPLINTTNIKKLNYEESFDDFLERINKK